MANHSISGNPFFGSVPQAIFWPVLILSVAAASIASQAVISATFSLLSQAISMDYMPPMHVRHTNKSFRGQVYLPTANWIVMVITLWLVVFFQSSTKLASAYGLAVTGTITMTTIIFMVMAVLRWHLSLLLVIPVGCFFLVIDLAFFTGCLIKFPDGGWVSFAISLVLLIIMISWKLGIRNLHDFNRKRKRKMCTDEISSK